MNKKTIKDIDISGKRVFIRVDFNVPIMEGRIEDDTRILGALPTIEYAIEQGAKIILASHLGRPLKDKKKADENRGRGNGNEKGNKGNKGKGRGNGGFLNGQ